MRLHFIAMELIFIGVFQDRNVSTHSIRAFIGMLRISLRVFVEHFTNLEDTHGLGVVQNLRNAWGFKHFMPL